MKRKTKQTPEIITDTQPKPPVPGESLRHNGEMRMIRIVDPVYDPAGGVIVLQDVREWLLVFTDGTSTLYKGEAA